MTAVSRKRPLHLLALCLLPSATTALSAVTTARRSTAASRVQVEGAVSTAPLNPLLYQYELDDEEDEWDIQESVSTSRQLQESTGSEILQTDLQRQIDAGSPDDFLETHAGADASFLEKVAMRSITEQLPQKAVQALGRVTIEEEIQLARTIQEGARLRTLKEDRQLELDREISNQEWATAARLSPKELRRRVSDYRRAKHDLVKANLGLVHAVVKQQWAGLSRSGLSKPEMVQEGSLGLLRAAELFDPERGLRFSTYAVVWIKGTLSNSHFSELVRLPAREKTRWNKIRTAKHELEQQGTAVTIESLAATTGLSVSEVLRTQRQMGATQAVLSLDYEYASQSRSGTETASFAGMDKNLRDDNDLAERTQLQADVIAAMARNLDSREARLMRLRYGLSDGKTRSLAECADAMGLSQTRVQQLSQKCLKKLRQAAEAESLAEYLLTIA